MDHNTVVMEDDSSFWKAEENHLFYLYFTTALIAESDSDGIIVHKYSK